MATFLLRTLFIFPSSLRYKIGDRPLRSGIPLPPSFCHMMIRMPLLSRPPLSNKLQVPPRHPLSLPLSLESFTWAEISLSFYYWPWWFPFQVRLLSVAQRVFPRDGRYSFPHIFLHVQIFLDFSGSDWPYHGCQASCFSLYDGFSIN